MNGWKIVAVAAAAQLATFAAVVAAYGTDQQGVETLVRATARVSFLFFVPVYVASPLRRLWKNGATRWLLANRRYLGVSFCIAHLLHLDAIFMLSLLLGDAFRMDWVSFLGGGLAYLLVVAMAATSFDRAVAWLGPRRWRALHRFGLHYVAFIWFLQWTPLVFASLVYLPMALLVFAALAVRLAARIAAGRGGAAPATATS